MNDQIPNLGLTIPAVEIGEPLASGTAYISLKQLVEAIAGNEEPGVRAYLDNDDVSFYGIGPGEGPIYRTDPYTLQVDALALLGIEAESV